MSLRIVFQLLCQRIKEGHFLSKVFTFDDNVDKS